MAFKSEQELSPYRIHPGLVTRIDQPHTDGRALTAADNRDLKVAKSLFRLNGILGSDGLV